MKTLFILPLLLCVLYANNELSWVDEQVNAIKPNRQGTSESEIAQLKNPFVYLKKNLPKEVLGGSKSSTTQSQSTKKTKRTQKRYTKRSKSLVPYGLHLKAIINSSALINKKWYKLGDTVKGYKIVQVNKTSVKLRKNKRTALLTTKTKSKKLQFKE